MSPKIHAFWGQKIKSQGHEAPVYVMALSWVLASCYSILRTN